MLPLRESLSRVGNAGGPTRSISKYAIFTLLGIVTIYLLTISSSFKTTVEESKKDEEIVTLSQQLEAMTKKYNDLVQKAKSTTTKEPEKVDVQQLFVDALIASGSDKYYRHHYENYYKHWMIPYRDVPKMKFLEIGADYGKSLLLWSNYFTDPELILGLAYGILEIDDIVNEHHKTGKLKDVVQVVKGDQSKEETMEVLRKMGPFHIILDDGSHLPEHIGFSLFSLWKSIVPGGMYIIEDLECSYWSSGSAIYGYPLIGTGIGTSPKVNFVEKVKQLIDTLVKRQIGATDDVLSIMPGDETICSMEFGKNLVVLRKCTEAEMANAPPLLPTVFDRNQMAEWVKNAKSTNPDGFQ